MGEGGGATYNGLNGEAPPERGTLFRLQVKKRVGISLIEVYKRVGKSVISFCKNGLTNAFYGLEKIDKTSWFWDLFIV